MSKNKNYILRLLPAFIIFQPSLESLAQVYPLSENNWNNPEFRERFMGSYGVNTRTEPEVTVDEADLFQQIIPLVQADDVQGAIDLLGPSITEDSSAALDYTLGNLYFQLNNFTEAATAYQKAIRKFPNFLRAYDNIGRVYVQDGAYEEALPFLVKAIELGGNTSDLYGLLGFSYLNLGMISSASNAYRMAIVLNPENRDWRIGMAQAYLLSEKYEDAVPLLNELIDDEDLDTQILLSLANAHLGMGNVNKAASILEIVRRIGTPKPSSLILLGDIYTNDGLENLAIVNYLEALTSDDTVQKATALRIVRIFLQRSKFDEASRFIEQIYETYGDDLSDDDQLVLLNSRAQIALGNGEMENAIALLEEVIAINPLNGEALLTLGNYHWRTGQREEAAFYFTNAEKVREVRREALIQHGRMLVENKEYAKAAQLLNQAHELQPDENLLAFVEAVKRVRDASQ